MSLQLKAIAIIVSLLALAGIYATGYMKGRKDGKEIVNREWAIAKDAAAKESFRLSEFAHSKAIDLQKQLDDISRLYAKSSVKIVQSAKLECPKSGKLGDVVIPADVVDSVFGNSAGTD